MECKKWRVMAEAHTEKSKGGNLPVLVECWHSTEYCEIRDIIINDRTGSRTGPQGWCGPNRAVEPSPGQYGICPRVFVAASLQPWAGVLEALSLLRAILRLTQPPATSRRCVMMLFAQSSTDSLSMALMPLDSQSRPHAMIGAISVQINIRLMMSKLPHQQARKS